MKTENEFSEYFFQIYQDHIQAPAQKNPLVVEINPEDLKSLCKVYWIDLTAHLSFYFSNEDRLKITAKAAQLLAEKQKTHEFFHAWKLVLTDFNQNDFWGFEKIAQKPKIAQTEEQKIFWTLFKYAWTLFQSMVVLKIAVYYFGLQSASHPDQVSSIWVWIFFGLSAFILGFFAYVNHNE